MGKGTVTAVVTGLLAGVLLASCGSAVPYGAPQAMTPQTGARTRVLSASRPNANQAKLLSQFSRDENRPVVLKRDSFGHPVIGPELSASDKALLKTLDGDRRSNRETTSRSLPSGLMTKATHHFEFFAPGAKTTPRLVPLMDAAGRQVIGYRAEVEMTAGDPEDGHDLYFAYYDRNGRLLAANG